MAADSLATRGPWKLPGETDKLFRMVVAIAALVDAHTGGAVITMKCEV